MTTTEEKTDNEVTNQHHYNHRRRAGMLIGAVVFVLVIFGAGVAAGHLGSRLAMDRPGGFGPAGMSHQMRGGFGGPDDSASQLANQSRLVGVVTAVNGDVITIAGGGSTNTVTTNSTTQYTNGSKAAVNDTVMVLGTTNNGTFTATQVTINPARP